MTNTYFIFDISLPYRFDALSPTTVFNALAFIHIHYDQISRTVTVSPFHFPYAIDACCSSRRAYGMMTLAVGGRYRPTRFIAVYLPAR